MPSEPNPPRIFISYARSDGKAQAAELRRRLEKERLTLWRDLEDMEGGRDWWQQIVEAIRHVEYVVLVMTPAAVASPHVRREWRLARQEGKNVIPVTGAPDLDISGLPRWMRQTHFVDPTISEQWDRFVLTLKSPRKVPRVPLMIDDDPSEDFVQRPREFKALKSHLVDVKRAEPVAITVVLLGAAGYGKTALTRALCHDEDIQEAFHDGILWVTLGQTPGDLTRRVEDLIYILEGERPGFAGLEAATTRFAEVLADRTVLIVIDDVWNAADLRPFLQGGRRCARLVTARNSGTVPTGAAQIHVEAMQPAEADALLGQGLPDSNRSALRRLAARLGKWPLLLKLVNGVLRERVVRARQPLPQAIDYVNEALERHGLTVFDDRNSKDRDRARNQAVAKTLEVSLDQLSNEERARFAELAVFPGNVDIPLDAVETLWSATARFDSHDTDRLCSLLAALSLLMNLDRTTRRINLHEAVRLYLQPKDSPVRKSLHCKLIGAYRARCSGGWWNGPDDGYFFSYLPHHLLQSGRMDIVYTLLLDYRWIAAKLNICGISALISDYDLMAEDGVAGWVQRSLRLSSHILACDRTQLACQLLGRLAPDGALIDKLLADVHHYSISPALLPIRQTLTPPGTPLLRRFEGHEDWVLGVAAIPNEQHRVISASADRTLRLWDLNSGDTVQRYIGHEARVRAVSVTPDGQHAVSASDDRTLRLWDLESGTELRRFEGHAAAIFAVALTPDGQRAISASQDMTLRLWELNSGTELRCLVGHMDTVRGLAVLPDGQRAISASDDGTLRLWDLESGIQLRCFKAHKGGVFAVALTANGRRAISASDDRTLRLWNLPDGTELTCFEGHEAGVRAVALTPDGRRAISTSDDRTLRVWDLERGTELRRFEGHEECIRALALTPDGQRVVSTSDDRTLRLWALDSGVELRQLERHNGLISAVAVMPDGWRAISASADRTLRLWDLNRGSRTQSL